MAKHRASAYQYMRVSSPGQANDKKHGFKRQDQTIARYAKANGLRIVDTFKDAIAGKQLDRPGLTALFAALAGDGVRLVLVEYADRLARDTLVSLLLLEQFKELGVQVIDAECGSPMVIDGDTNPTAKLMLDIRAAIAQFEKTRLVIKLRLARAAKSKALGHRCEGRKALGTTVAEQASIAALRELYRKPRGGARRSFAKIAAMMNERELPSKTGRPWTRGTVQHQIARLGLLK